MFHRGTRRTVGTRRASEGVHSPSRGRVWILFLACSCFSRIESEQKSPRKSPRLNTSPRTSMSHTHHDEGRFYFEPGVDVAAFIFEHLKDTKTRAALSCVSRTWREAKQRDRARYSTRTTWEEEYPFEYPFKSFVGDVRPKIIAENPEFTFGEVCRELDAQWAKLSDVEKTKYMGSCLGWSMSERAIERWNLRGCGWT